MRQIVELLRGPRQTRIFFIAYAQSALGTGAAYVALLLLAYDRFRSPWAIALVLIADFLPPMLLGPLFGAAADRWSRRGCAVVADLARAAAFIGIGLVDGFGATLALALVAGAGTGLFRPAIMAGLPSLVEPRRLAPAVALYSALTEIGFAVGPGLAAVFLLVASPDTVLVANGATFALSALLLAGLSFGARPPRPVGQSSSILAEARRGLGATARMPAVRTVIVAAGSLVLFGGMINVAELLLVKDLGAGDVAYSLLVAASGAGVALGTLVGAAGGGLQVLKRRYLRGIAIDSVGLLLAGATRILAVVVGGVAVAGLGNGTVMVHERLIIQATVEDGLRGRVFGVQYALDSAAFGAAFVLAGAVLTLIGPRSLFLLAGAGALLVWAASSLLLRRAWEGEPLAAEQLEVPATAGEPLPTGSLDARR